MLVEVSRGALLVEPQGSCRCCVGSKRRVCCRDAGRHDALYVVGALDETLELRGLRYHPIDIETSVSRAHRSIAEW